MMEDLYTKIVNHMIFKLSNGEYNLSMSSIAEELDIPAETLNKVVFISFLPNLLLKLSKDPHAQKVIERIRRNLDGNKSNSEYWDFRATRERIKEIEAKALKKFKDRNDDPPDDTA